MLIGILPLACAVCGGARPPFIGLCERMARDRITTHQEDGKMGRKRRNSDDIEPKIGADGAALTADRQKQLAGYISEIERWEGEKATIQADIDQIFLAAKETGFDTKAMRVVIKDRKKSKTEREAFDGVRDAYRHLLGMLDGTPLGEAAVARDLAPQGPSDTSSPPFAS
jgi:uncharacterized protein (UPF0335 family)